ncbi:hypothetical protein KQX54_005889 [Cotesia glomerata]|uniref:THAP-type domain-containing protein n=1 Tax=Cotesia glomerata TaxID=32391 RepID=A0AAV7ICZ6_COTGL|nr:hypothetical protein KQX54_005889 [Cotesia glomerata]
MKSSKCTEWIKLLGQKHVCIAMLENKLSNRRVCSCHFKPEHCTGKVKRQKTKDAVPLILDSRTIPFTDDDIELMREQPRAFQTMSLEKTLDDQEFENFQSKLIQPPVTSMILPNKRPCPEIIETASTSRKKICQFSSACRGLCELEKVKQEQYNKKEGKREQKGQQHSDLHRTYTVRHLSPIETRNSPRATLSDGTDGYPLTDTCEPRAYISTPLLHTSR